MFLNFSLAFFRHGSLWLYRLATAAVLLAGIGFVALVLALRYLVLPNIDDYREPIERMVTNAAGQPVSIGSITGSWQGYRPELRFGDVKVLDAQGLPVLTLDRVDAVLAWISLLSAQLRFDSLDVVGPKLEVRRDKAGVLSVAGLATRRGAGGGGRFGNWLLAQRQIVIRDATVVWIDEARNAPELRIDKASFRLDNHGGTHRFGLTGSPPAAVASQVRLRGEFHGRTFQDLQSWNGRLYAEFDYVSLVLAQNWIPAPLELSSGVGALRLWLDLAGPRIAAATADVSLLDTRGRLASDLPELGLSSLQGRLRWIDDGKRTELAAESLGFTTSDGLTLAPMQFSYASIRTPQAGERRSELSLEQLDLVPAVQLAGFLPLDPQLRSRLAQAEPAGMVEQARFSWTGAWDTTRPYAVELQFSDLSMKPSGVLPGLRGAGGRIAATERGGTLSLSIQDGGFDLPRVFSETVPLTVMMGEADWSFRNGQTYVTLKNAAFSNDHAAGSVRGSYHTDPVGRGTIDLTGMLMRADARQVWRYVPVMAPVTQAWLRRALLAGESRDVRLRLRGPLADFPFADEKTGLFEVIARASGVTLDFADGWPPVTGLAGEVRFRGRNMAFKGPVAELSGIPLSNMQASITELGRRDEHLLVKARAAAPTSKLIQVASASPVAGHLNNLADQVKVQGNAVLDLELDLPLHRLAESAIGGQLVVQDNRVTLDPRLPVLDKFNARIAFTRGGIDVREGRAQLLGNPVTFESTNRGGGGLALKLAGTMDAARLAEAFDARMLDALDGRFAWRGSVDLRNRIANIRFDSDLVGLASRLPAPFAKPAQAGLPLRLELRERAGPESELAISLGQLVSAQLLLDSRDPDGLKRGSVGLGTAAPVPAMDGLWIKGRIETLDVDAWRPVLAGTGGGKPIDVAGVDLEIGELDFSRRRLRQLKIDLARKDGAWEGTLGGKDIAGQVFWTPEGKGRLNARLARLSLPAPATDRQPAPPIQPGEDYLPSLDVVAENFVFQGRDLGRLTVLADPEATGWQLRKLEIVNPDSKLALSGHWSTDGPSKTDATVRLEASDIGRFFARLGWPEGVDGGTGLLEGPVSWTGNPAQLHIPTLSGKLRLEASKGRFRQVSPGAAKLLGIVSLQALPKRLTLDFDDVFSKGFSFDQISADLTIASGVAHTENFLMLGSAALVGMRGQVDLAAETQNLNLKVTPSLSESIAIAGAIINPAVGVAALIAQMALKDPFSQIAALEYTVTGPWAEPVVNRVNRRTEEPRGR